MHQLRSHGDLEQPGRDDAGYGQVPVALVVLRPGAPAAGLGGWVSQRLGRFKEPAEVILVPALPRTATGKVDRAAVWAAVRPASAAWESGKKS